MPFSCDDNGTNCTRLWSSDHNDNNHVIGFIFGSIAFLIFVIIVISFMYLSFCKRYFRNTLQIRSRLRSVSYNQEQSMNIDRNQQQPQPNPQRSLNEPPPSYQETNIDNNVSLNKKP